MNPSRLLVASAAVASLVPSARAQLGVVWNRALTQRTGGDTALGAGDALYHVGWWNGPATVDSIVTRIDPDGTVRWERWFDHVDGDRLRALATIPGGGVVACGWSDLDPSAAENIAVAVVRYDADGNEAWRRFVDASPFGDEIAFEARVTPAGEILVGGTGAPTPAGEDLGLWKFSADGTLLWSLYSDHAHGSRDRGTALEIDAQGNSVLLGDSLGHRLILVKADPNGTRLWQREFLEAGSGFSVATDVALDAAGNVHCLATSEVAGGNRVVVVKFDAAGTFVWQREVVGPGSFDDSPREIRVDVRGDVVVNGYFRRYEQSVEISDGFVARLSPEGLTRWIRTVDGPAHGRESLNGVLLDGDGDLYACGNLTDTTSAGPSQTLVIRYDAYGIEKWRQAYDTPHFTPSSDGWGEIFAGSDGTVFTAGTTSTLPPGPISVPVFARFERSTASLCFGDGSAIPCPCGNESGAGLGAGCVSSLGFGARLTDSGSPRLSADTFVLSASGMPNSNVVFFQGDNATAAPFGDGLLCTTGGLRRLRTRTIIGGSASYPLAGELPISVAGAVHGPLVRTYQALYRNASDFCTPATFNTTNALAVRWSL